ncbi:MAG: hypothetical protein B6A08_19275 [Sorangiineae bacterium NIC37A_2]|jgi:EAL domain-containing protein (putative c-di-GMP-specific phosphodiesterase class I)|nr:MAG: hypothetical protein B6A08_19275 [Sorangiineae bacterium NIC37A_2]
MEEQEEAAKPRVSGGTVLLVDDDLDVLREYGKILERMGVQTIVAENGATALRFLAEQTVDAVITDLNMPVMNGMNFLREVRAVHLDIPVIMVTGFPRLRSAMIAVEYGAFHYLTKPVEPDKLRETVTRALNMHALCRIQRQAAALAEIPQVGLPDRAALEARFNTALDRLWMAYQPIVSWSQTRVFAYEALVRSGEETLASPAALFETAELLGRTAELGRTIRSRVGEIAEQTDGSLLFVNLNPVDLNDDDLYSEDAVLRPYAHRVVFEITERSQLAHISGLSSRIAKLRKKGYRIAIDDLGAGYSSLTSFVHLEPDFVKIDMSLVRGVDSSMLKRRLVRGLFQICSGDLGIQVICEGVETEAERETLCEDGIDLLQGYYFAKPERILREINFLKTKSA